MGATCIARKILAASIDAVLDRPSRQRVFTPLIHHEQSRRRLVPVPSEPMSQHVPGPRRQRDAGPGPRVARRPDQRGARRPRRSGSSCSASRGWWSASTARSSRSSTAAPTGWPRSASARCAAPSCSASTTGGCSTPRGALRRDPLARSRGHDPGPRRRARRGGRRRRALRPRVDQPGGAAVRPPRVAGVGRPVVRQRPQRAAADDGQRRRSSSTTSSTPPTCARSTPARSASTTAATCRRARSSATGWKAHTTFDVQYRNFDDPLVETGEHPLVQPQRLYKEIAGPTSAIVRLYHPLTDKTVSFLFACSPHERPLHPGLQADVARRPHRSRRPAARRCWRSRTACSTRTSPCSSRTTTWP